MLAEELFGFFNTFPVNETHVSDAAVCKLIHYWTSQPACKVIVEQGSDVAPNVAKTITRKMFILPSAIDFHAAGGTMTSDGKGMKELSMAINIVTTQ